MSETTEPRIRRVVRRLTLRHAPRRNRRIAAVLTLLLAVILFTCLWPVVHAHLQAAAVLDRVAGNPVPRLLALTDSGPVTVTDTTIPTPDGPLRARLYTPTQHPGAPALVLFHGVHHLGMDEPRLIAFARAISACGLRVLTPELPGIKDYHVGPASTRAIGESVAWMATQGGDRSHRPVGVMGLSFAGGLSLLAAADPHYGGFMKFVVAVGSQGSMSRVATYYRTGLDVQPQGPDEKLPPHEYGALVLEYESLEDFVPAADIEPMRAMLRAHLYEDAPAEKDAFAAMSPAQHAEAMQLLDTTSDLTHARLLESARRHEAAMGDISPDAHLSTLHTPVYLLHGAGDNIIPAAETLWMASELPNESLRAVLVSPVLSHLNLDGAKPTALDQWRLVHFFALILRDAEWK